MSRFLHLTNAGLAALLVGGSLWTYPHLPPRIPRHFGITGIADAYWETSLVHWMLLPLLAVVLAGGLYVVARMLVRAPESINVSNQATYDALEPGQKKMVVGVVRRFLYWTTFGILVVFSAAQLGTYQVALSQSNALPPLVLVILGTFLVGLGGGTVWLARTLPRYVADLADDS